MKLWHGADYNYEQWLDRPEVLDEDFEAMQTAGCNVMTVGVFSWAQYEPREGEYHWDWMDGLLDRLHAQGMKAILATPSAARPAWMSLGYPEVLRVDARGRRAQHAGRHNHCRTSPIYREKVAQINTRLAERYGRHPAVALWHVSNEYNGGPCYCDLCLAAFRAWLKDRYKTLETLNRAWWTTFWSHRFDTWEEIYPDDSSINAMMLDWQRFSSYQTVDFYKAEIVPLRQFSSVPITTNFHGPHVGLDYFEFAKHVDVVSWDSYPRWHQQHSDVEEASRTAFLHDLFRSTRGKPFLLMESTPSQTNWHGVSPLKRPGMHWLASAQALAHGADSVQYFQWRQSRGGEEKFHGAVLSHSRSSSRTFQDVAEVGRHLASLDALAGLPVEASAAVLLDFENSWAIDLAQLPQSDNKRYWDECRAAHGALWGRGFSADVVDSKPRNWSQYRLIVAPMLYMVRSGLAAEWTSWVEKGGHLVVTYMTGLVDEHDLCFDGGAPGPLTTLLGVAVAETDALAEHHEQSFVYQGSRFPARHYADIVDLSPSVEVVSTYEHQFYAGRPAVTRRRLGQGTVWYVATRSTSAFWDAFLFDRCADAGVQPAVSWNLPEGVSVRRRGAFTFVMNFTAHEVVVVRGPGEDSLRLPGYGVHVLR